MAKTFISGYTRKDGVYVAAHNDKRIKNLRHGTLRRQVDGGEAAYEEMIRFAREKLGGSVLGTAIPKGFKDVGRVSLIGQVARTPEDLAMLAQVYRDPRIETFRVFYMKGDAIVGQTGVTSRLPGLAKPFLGPTGETHARFALENMKQQMAALGADGYWLLHNHPSGDSTPSKSDLNLTAIFNREVPGLLGHLIINSSEYDCISKDGKQAEKFALEPIGYDLKSHGLPHDWLGTQFYSGPFGIVERAKLMQRREGATTIIGLNKTVVTLICEVPDKVFSEPRGPAHLRILGRMAGASGGLHAITSLNLREFVERGLLTQAYNPDTKQRYIGSANVKLTAERPGLLGGKRLKGYPD